MKIDISGFERAAQRLAALARTNAMVFGQSVARAFETRARSGAAWTDRTGAARRRLYGRIASGSGGKVVVEMGGSAPNYKAGRRSYPDYMEILEFGGNSLSRNFPDLSIVYPTFEAIRQDAVKQYGQAALSSGGVRMYRDRGAARRRGQAFRRRAR